MGAIEKKIDGREYSHRFGKFLAAIEDELNQRIAMKKIWKYHYVESHKKVSREFIEIFPLVDEYLHDNINEAFEKIVVNGE